MALNIMSMIVRFLVIAVLSTRVKGQAAINVMKVSEGDQVVLDCERLPGVPGIIAWRHEDQTILFGITFQDENGAYLLDTETPNHWKIIIPSVNYARDGGMWFCSSDDVENRMLTTIDLIVLFAPYNVMSTDDLTPQLSSHVILNCSAEGSPSPNVVWSRSYPRPYIELGEGSLKGFVRGTSVAVLDLEVVNATNRGEYVCSITNGVPTDNNQKVLRRTTYLQLPYAPEVQATLPMVRVTAGSQAVLACVSQAYPPTSSSSDVMWTKDSQDVRSTGGNQLEVFQPQQNFHGERYISTLTINGVTNQLTGIYECRFTNSQGTATASVTLALEPTVDPNFGA